jgi:hypothetical protein
MKFTIREMLLVIVVVAVLLAWLIDHRAAVGRERAWQQAFHKALESLSFHVQTDPVTVESPVGPWQVHCTVAVQPPDGAE